MNRFRNLKRFVAAALLVAASAVAASAQVQTIEGKVTLKQADGTEVPVQGATVEIFRTDVTQKLGSVKTDKSGKYVRVGLPLIGTYTILVSAPGATPNFQTGVRVAQRNTYDFSLTPGDGRVLKLEELNKLAASTAGAPPADTEEAKKQAAAMAAERERIEKENARAAELNVKLPDILKAGNDAFMAKNYDLAVAKYNEGIAADPEQSVFPRNKSVALTNRATPKYNAAVKAKDEAGKEAARSDLKAAVEAAEKAVANFRANKAKSGGAAGAAAPAGKSNEELGYLADRYEAYRLAFLTLTPVDNDAAAKAIGEYVEMETDAAKKNKAQALLGEALFNAGKVDESVAKFREILAANPNNVEAMRGLGISLAAKGAEDPEMLPEAIKSLEQFVAKSPDTDTRKQEAAMMVEELKGTIKELANKPQPTQPQRGNQRRRP
ncbi:MAG TPA: carboxypeptidase regulatory-like domain-containing protein [Pyrinomonadaceae bacterium]|nr:carboxypeptidase regulatory-like domain-containing protein [Pyrinomonadaceae bacterium]